MNVRNYITLRGGATHELGGGLRVSLGQESGANRGFAPELYRGTFVPRRPRLQPQVKFPVAAIDYTNTVSLGNGEFINIKI